MRHITSNDPQSIPPGHSQDIQERSATRICRHSGRLSSAPTHPPPLPPPAIVLREDSGVSSAAPLPDPVERGAASPLAVSNFEFPPESEEYSFADAFKVLPSQQLERALASLALLHGAEVAWQSLLPTADATAEVRAVPREFRKCIKLQFRIAVGRDVLRCCPANRGTRKYSDYL